MNDTPLAKPHTPSHPSSSIDCGRSRHVAIVGLLSGAAIAMVVPLMLLRFGDRLSAQQQLIIIIIIAIAAGGLVALTAAFFGTVMPRTVRDDPSSPCAKREDTQAAQNPDASR